MGPSVLANEFLFESFFLPSPKRGAVRAVGAFCGLIQKAIVDAGAESGQTAVDLLAQRLDDIYAERLELPKPEFRDPTQRVLVNFGEALGHHEIPRQYFLEFAEGCRADLVVRRYATWASLEKHCRQCGGAVGLILGSVLGQRHSESGQYAALMGSAVRFTNIVRDIHSDNTRGWIYLPLEDMARVGYSERDLSGGVVNERFGDLMKFEMARARELFRAAAEGICWLADDGSRLAVSMLVVAHIRILNAIERSGYDLFRHKPRLGAGHKLMCLPAAWKLARREPDQPLPAVFG